MLAPGSVAVNRSADPQEERRRLGARGHDAQRGGRRISRRKADLGQIGPLYGWIDCQRSRERVGELWDHDDPAQKLDSMLVARDDLWGSGPRPEPLAPRHALLALLDIRVRLTNKVQLRSHIIKWCGPKGRAILTSGSVSCNRR